MKPKLDLSWGLSWPHVGGLGACWGILRRCLDDLKAMPAASEPLSKNPCAYASNMFTTYAFNICLQIACTMLVTSVGSHARCLSSFLSAWHNSAILGRSEGNAFTCQSELAARAAGGERASVEESMRICFQELTRNQVS